jgi:hypothetical protein
MKVGITGHQRLKDPADWGWVEANINKILTQCGSPLVGITSLAIGSDQLFADLVLRQSGSIEAIIPFQGYEGKFEGHERQRLTQLLNKASRIEILNKKQSDEESYFEAGKRVVDIAEILIGVWDGKPAAGLGGTADVVCYATRKHKRVIHINPELHTIADPS